ncbi:MAG TPA: phosphoenolpyruvate kinase [Acidimicrobiia bacterium]|nr:phosphoenolpyruvate kinase [Acidimicrobiia bacterium]
MTLTDASMSTWGERLGAVTARLGRELPGEGPERQPVHTVYGGAHLFSAGTATRLGELSLEFMDRWAGSAEDLVAILGLPQDLADEVHRLVRAKLTREPVEDFRIDFEDGYGHRPDHEEDGHARSAATELAAGMAAGSLPPFTGIRVKSLSGELHRRSLRTLDFFVTTAVEQGGRLPEGFAVTLPKIQDVEQVVVLTEALGELERGLGIEPIPVELMVETPQTIVDGDGSFGMRKFVQAGSGRVRGAHFGTYDYTASLSVTAAYQTMTHAACDFARHGLQVSLAGTGVWISDGATNVMPVPPHRGDDLSAAQVEENRKAVHETMRLHYDHVRHSLAHAFYQGWDLHPAQFPTRYAAVYAFFLEGLDQAASRLSNFVESAAKATMVGEVFDDAATGQGLLNFFLRAINCGAIGEDEATSRTGLTLEEIQTRSFLAILEGRTGQVSERP